MSFVTGLLLLDASGSALNNAGKKQGTRTDNATDVKQIRARDGGAYPYVSAQAFRYWLRNTLEQSEVNGWKAAPVRKESENLAYTDANPIRWWDDDLLGYMRAPGDEDGRSWETSMSKPKSGKPVLTRVSPFRISPLVSIAPVNITEDFGVMSRHEGNPVLHEHDFYRATLKGLFSLDLNACGTFSYRDKTGFRNLDDNRKKEAEEHGLAHIEKKRSYRLKKEDRVKRIAALFDGLAQLEGGAKLTLHYTDVMPAFVVMAVTKGGNHIFNYVIGADNRGRPQVNTAGLKEAVEVYRDTILSPIYVGWPTGYLDNQREGVQAVLEELKKDEKLKQDYELDHPRRAFQKMAAAIRNERNASWLE